MASLPQFPPFNVHAEGSTSTRWKKWKDRLDNLLVAMNITNANRKKALLLHYAGEEVHNIFSKLTLAPHCTELLQNVLNHLSGTYTCDCFRAKMLSFPFLIC